MNVDIWFVYVFTVLVLMSTPGPSQLLMLTNSAVYGFRKSFLTAIGDLSANAIQMLLAALGIGAIISSSGIGFEIVKWIGIAYLVWRGYATIKNAQEIHPMNIGRKTLISKKQLFAQGFITSMANPKAILFFAALFPQFINGNDNFWIQFLILSFTYIIIDGIFLTLYGIGSQKIISIFKMKSTLIIERIGGAILLLAALLLASKSADDVFKIFN